LESENGGFSSAQSLKVLASSEQKVAFWIKGFGAASDRIGTDLHFDPFS
jgi:hypothetical protein